MNTAKPQIDRKAIQPGLVSTIVPVYNRANLLCEAVDSVLAQCYPEKEVIIVNDGSTDDTHESIASLEKKYQHIIVAIHQPNLGPGAAREAGRLISRGEYLQYLDSDDVLLPGKFETQVKGLNKSPNACLSYGKTRAYRRSAPVATIPSRKSGKMIQQLFPEILLERPWHTVTPLYRRSVCDRIGPWKNLKQEEDWEYDCRIAALHLPLHFCDEFIAEQIHHDQDRLCLSWQTNKMALRDRALAHCSIFQHAMAARVPGDGAEMKSFVRTLFYLTRLCASAGLTTEAKQLFGLASTVAVEHKIEFRLFKIIANCIGWKHASRLLDNSAQNSIPSS